MSDEKQTMPAEVVCRSCGKTNIAGMRFCGFCGNPLEREAPAVTAKPVTPPLPSSVLPPSGAKPPALPVRPNVPPPPPSALPGRATASPSATSGNKSDSERERERLISQATSLRVKGQITDARLNLEKAISISDGMPPAALAPLYEQVGDLLLIEDMFDDAIGAYNRAQELDPKRVSVQKKHAEATLQKAQATGKLSISETLLRGDSVADIIASGELGGNRGKRNAGLAMFLSILMPGFGQFYNGQLMKGIVLAAVFVISLLVLSMSPEKDKLFQDITAIFAMKGSRASFAVSPLITVFALLGLGSWLYAIVDAPFSAGKTHDTDTGGPTIDKSGWEV